MVKKKKIIYNLFGIKLIFYECSLIFLNYEIKGESHILVTNKKPNEREKRLSKDILIYCEHRRILDYFDFHVILL